MSRSRSSTIYFDSLNSFMEVLQRFSACLGSVGLEVLGPRSGHSKCTLNPKLWLPSGHFGIFKLADDQPKKGVTIVQRYLTLIIMRW